MNKSNGITGLMRVKNDKDFIERCVESCIGALDELVIVYNDCSDGSEDEIERMRKQHPEKIKVYAYPYKVLGAGLTKEEYELAKSLPDDSPQLLCNYYNFALSKASFRYAIKIDADQIYFTDELKRWCDYCRSEKKQRFTPRVAIGCKFQIYLSVYRMLSLKLKKRLPMMPQWFIKVFSTSYDEYAKYLFAHSKACLSFSGLNILESDDERYVTFGRIGTGINILPPFNGEGDHVLFEISENTRYEKFDMPYYNIARANRYSLIEEFKHPYRIVFMGFMWTHIAIMREGVRDKAEDEKRRNPKLFAEISRFLDMSFTEIDNKSDKEMFSLFQRILFSFVYPKSRQNLKERFSK